MIRYKKKLIITKNASNNTKLGSESCLLLSANSVEYDLSPYRERRLYKLTGKMRKRSFFTYLHSLFFSLHKNYNRKEPTKFASSNLKDYSLKYQQFKKKHSLENVVKLKRTFTNYD